DTRIWFGSAESGSDPRRAHDARVGEDVEVVPARRRELRHDSAVVTRLEPMHRVRWDRVLLAGEQRDPLPLDPQVDAADPAANRLLLAGRALERRVPVLRAGLLREQHELLRAVAIGVDVDEQHQPGGSQLAEAEVRDLDALELVGAEGDARRRELLGGVLL